MHVFLYSWHPALNFVFLRIIDNMPVTWCYEVQTDVDDVNDQSKYCSPGFPVGCFVDAEGNRKDACVIDVSQSYKLLSKK